MECLRQRGRGVAAKKGVCRASTVWRRITASCHQFAVPCEILLFALSRSPSKLRSSPLYLRRLPVTMACKLSAAFAKGAKSSGVTFGEAKAVAKAAAIPSPSAPASSSTGPMAPGYTNPKPAYINPWTAAPLRSARAPAKRRTRVRLKEIG